MSLFSVKEVVSLINFIEESLPVQNWKIEGVQVWPVARKHIRDELDSVKAEADSVKEGSLDKFQSHLYGLSKIFKNFISNSFEFQFRLRQCDVLFLTYSNAKKNKIEGEWVNTFVDPLADVLKNKNVKYRIIEHDKNYDIKIPSKKKYKLIQHRIFSNNFKSLLANKFKNSESSHEVLTRKINDIINSYGVDKKILEFSYLKKRVLQILAHKNYFLKIIDKLRPKVVFLSSYYTTVEMGMILACREYNIPSVDIQHGAQGRFHVGYGSWKNVPENGYELLPAIFAVWSEHEKEIIDDWAHDTPHRPVVLGNTMVQLYKNLDSKNAELSASYDESKINVLITLQTGRGLPEIYYQLIKRSKNIEFWVRAHPSMTSSERENIKLKLKGLNNCYFDLASNALLYQLFSYVDIHITQNSSVTIESANFNIPTIVTHETGRDEYERLIKKGVVFYLTEPKLIEDKIEQLSKNKSCDKIDIQDNRFEESVLSIIDLASQA
jgi:hypothetical protein